MSPTNTVLAVVLIIKATVVFFTCGFAENVTVYDRIVEEGKSIKLECHPSAASPFYYYRYFVKNINPGVVIAETMDEWPWPVYAINASYSLTNLRIIPKLVARSEHPLVIKNFTVGFHNNLICCQGRYNQRQSYQLVASLSTTICYHVNVQYSPRLLSPINYGEWIMPLHPSYGQEVVMSCPLEGNPSASYKWYFEKFLGGITYYDSIPIYPGSHLNITFLNNNRTLVFHHFKEEHNGYYICNAENSLGNNTHYLSVKVKECTAFQPAHPSVTISASHNLVAYVGDDLRIDCVVASWPQSSDDFMKWLKNGHDHEIPYEASIPPAKRVCYSKGSFDKVHCRQFITLNIRNLTFNDSGKYSCIAGVSDYFMVTDTMVITVTVPISKPNYKPLIVKISIPVSVVIFLLAIFVAVGTYYYQRKSQIKLQKALEEYQKRPLPKKDGYQYEFFFAMTEEDEDKLEVDKLYVVLKQSFSIYYYLDQYLPGRTKVEMVTEGIKNSRFIILMLSRAYLQQKDEITRLELMYTLNRIGEEFTKCAFIITLQDNLHIPYKLRHIMKFSKENADIKLRELALSSDIYGPDSIASEDTELVDDDDDNGMELELLNN